VTFLVALLATPDPPQAQGQPRHVHLREGGRKLVDRQRSRRLLEGPPAARRAAPPRHQVAASPQHEPLDVLGVLDPAVPRAAQQNDQRLLHEVRRLRLVAQVTQPVQPDAIPRPSIAPFIPLHPSYPLGPVRYRKKVS
jgi:hypothetical protein